MLNGIFSEYDDKIKAQGSVCSEPGAKMLLVRIESKYCIAHMALVGYNCTVEGQLQHLHK